ncbi:magnesium/cobalt transporter CorA [Helicobacter saguini]|uniref:Magnesium transport protein CorA n=1 Tax=Helicobacter saguini TaxID=1548018 RepID=A0A347VS39_9HELI|nr:magnesium/cobalt transporter CorA [Helicobacter saguini]MWV62664.1 magnesium/cobalt transporter CorA [Helicobacter saguini]MWV66664.1 magnesium/cobalt transporter CorA [Helicobacter saguini]MWV69014.1 magnesium/cobalt transporter CorA [Helicobacter saguini]MWV71432.1 magnesium/cobalt transporter CorA [Helicobacter saguini]TLD94082.1 magnesium/cobalt transporter CorA [Helicobacter saguini]
MLWVYTKASNGLVQKLNFNTEDNILPQNILWMDLLHPSSDEMNYISKRFNLEIPTQEEREEIELSARYWEDNTTITINTHFLMRVSGEELKLVNETITFMMTQNILFTIRFNDFKIFDDIQNRILASPKNFEDGYDVLDKMFEVRVEKDADILEWIDKEARKLRINVLEQKSEHTYDGLLKGISSLQELNMRVRDSLFDKRRAMTSLIKSDKIDSDIKRNLTIVLKDLNSLVEFNVAQLNVLDNIQTILANQINIEQNKIIKLFTVATVAMMPPTLIGTIYGMNFEVMPELKWEYGYPIVIILMIISTILPVIAFKKKGWL